MKTVTEIPAQAIWAAARPLEAGPKSVSIARRFAVHFLTGTAKLSGEHVDDVVLVVSELVTNAIKYGQNGRRNIYLDLEVWSKWTLITVDDRDPAVYETTPVTGNEELRESGRGLKEIVEVLAERFWWDCKTISKTANAAILRTDVKLTDDDHAILEDLENER